MILPSSFSLIASIAPALCAVALLLGLPSADAASRDLGNGFKDHGVCAPISNQRGTVVTIDKDGNHLLLSLLSDHRGGYQLLLVDPEKGASEYPLPFKNSMGDYPYSCLLSSKNKLYTHFASNFMEFDVDKRAFTFCQKSAPQMAMGMTEDDKGVIWSITYPQSGVVSFNPDTREFHDYGHVYKQPWAQYQRHVAADDAGLIYFGLGNTASQLVAFDPKTGKAKPLLPESERKKGIAYLYRDTNGTVYGQPLKGDNDNWYELYKGSAKKIGKHGKIQPKPTITGDQALRRMDFADGWRVSNFNLETRKFAIEDANKRVKEISFDYSSEGAAIMGTAAAPDGTVRGGTTFPMRAFCYDPKKDELTNVAAHGQWNTVTRQNDRFFVGSYPGGSMLELDTAKPLVPTAKGNPNSNPQLIIPDCDPTIHRPHALLAHPDGKTIIMGGTPEYGYTGGGLCFWDRESRTRTLLTDQQVIADQSTMSLVALPGGKLLGGTTTSPGTGGLKKAREAQLYLMDMATKKIEWRQPLFPKAQDYADMRLVGDMVYGIVDREIFFVFDPAAKKIVHQQNLKMGKSGWQQGPRLLVAGPEGRTLLLLNGGIASIDPKTYEVKVLAKSRVSIDNGGDCVDGRIYFVSGSHLYSYGIER